MGLMSLAPVVIAAVLIFGCAGKTPQPAAPATSTPLKSHPQWHCSPKADQAMADGDIETGLHEHARFVAKHPENPLAHYHLGYAFGQTGDIKQEIAHYEEAVSLGYDDNDQLFFNLAMAYGELGQLEKAVAALEKSLAIAPEAVDTLTELSRLYREADDKKNERRILERLFELIPENATIKQRLKELDAK
jgi:tetratricopeptide (TPR) repeat protein